MGWLEKLFGDKEDRTKKATDVPAGMEEIQPREVQAAPFSLPGLGRRRFGRYNDNNKTQEKQQKWYDADAFYRAKDYSSAIAAFFDYLRDEKEDNVQFYPGDDGNFTFKFYQGSKRIHGKGNLNHINAWSPLAIMERTGVPAMRRLLELNYHLMYTRCSMTDDNTLCMMFETDTPSASPIKLYNGLRELAVRADRQDDLLLADFDALRATDTAHIQSLSEEELSLKFSFFQTWIREGLAAVATVNPDSFAGAVSYVLLGVVYRINFLLAPEARLLESLEKIHRIYWSRKDEITLIERNEDIRKALRKLLEWSREDFAASVYLSAGTFSPAATARMEKLKESINGANRDTAFYIENKYPELALRINEYGMLYAHSSYSLPRVTMNLTAVYLAVLHPEFFKGLGMAGDFYEPATHTFHRDAIESAVDKAISEFNTRYPQLKWDHGKIKYTSLFDFCQSFSEQLAGLNLEAKK